MNKMNFNNSNARPVRVKSPKATGGYKIRNSNGGYIALISIMLVSFILLAITFTLSTSGFFLRFNVFDSENKKQSLDLAESCVHAAMLFIAKGATVYPQKVDVGKNSCQICSILPNPPVTGPFTVLTRAVYKGAYTNMTAVLDRNITNTDFVVNSWNENATYLGPACPVP